MDDPMQILTEKAYNLKKHGFHAKKKQQNEILWYRHCKSIKQIRQMYGEHSSDSSDFKSDSSMADY